MYGAPWRSVQVLVTHFFFFFAEKHSQIWIYRTFFVSLRILSTERAGFLHITLFFNGFSRKLVRR